MSFQKHYVHYAPVWIVLVAIAIMFAPFSIRRLSATEPPPLSPEEPQPLSPAEREELQRLSNEMREIAE